MNSTENACQVLHAENSMYLCLLISVTLCICLHLFFACVHVYVCLPLYILSLCIKKKEALNTFYLPLYGLTHMVKDHSDSERGNPLPSHRLLFPISSKGYFISHRQDNTYHGLCYISRGALAGMRNSSMGPAHKGSIRRPIAP